jgi:hypothetical protein
LPEISKQQYEFLDNNKFYKCLDTKPKKYIADVVTLLDKKIGLENIKIISLFGSQISSKERCTISDCDLLIIVENSISNKILREIEPFLLALEIKHNYRANHSNLLKSILNTIQLSTGMFVSHFLTKEKYCKETNFYKMFKLSELLSFLIAPRRLVLNSVLENNHSLYGPELRVIIPEKLTVSVFDMLKSFTMNLFISLFALLIIPFKSLKPIKYQLEAIKWSLRAVNYYIFEDATSLPSIIKRFSYMGNGSFQKYHTFYRKFLYLRNNPNEYVNFMVTTPFRILRLHLKGLKMRNHKISS